LGYTSCRSSPGRRAPFVEEDQFVRKKGGGRRKRISWEEEEGIKRDVICGKKRPEDGII